MNELKTINEILDLMKIGYGYNQLLNKMNMTHEDMVNLTSKYLDVKNVLIKRYNVDLLTKVGENRDVISKGKTKNSRKSKGDTE